MGAAGGSRECRPDLLEEGPQGRGAESFMKTFKVEAVYVAEYETFELLPNGWTGLTWI